MGSDPTGSDPTGNSGGTGGSTDAPCLDSIAAATSPLMPLPMMT
jgi:hypothetical protein